MSKESCPILQIATVTLIFALASSAHAQQPPSRDTGVGKEIAAQGNRALQVIRAELKTAVKAMQPVLPAASHVVKMSLPAGATVATGATVACEQ